MSDLIEKVAYTQELIQCWYEAWNGRVYVAFSGGWDSTVLLHLVRELYPHVIGMFMNTTIEFPEIVRLVKETPNVVTLRPKMSFKGVLNKYGYPIVSKDVATAISRYKNTKRQDQKDYR